MVLCGRNSARLATTLRIVITRDSSLDLYQLLAHL